MRHGSLFSGIGGFDLAAEWMGWENIFHCEWNPFGQRVLKHYWPNAKSYNDITQTDFTIHRGAIDILTGGFPCQPYSTAGKRKGKEDERHLWPQMLRAIREIAPKYIVGENVLGLVNWNGGLVFDEVQADLESAGYEVQAVVIPAAAVNAPHGRDRVWFVAHACRHGGQKNTESERVKNEENTKQFECIHHSRLAADTDSNGQLECNCNDEINASERRINALGDIGTSNVNWDATDTSHKRLQGCKVGRGFKRRGAQRNEQPSGLFRTDWQEFPTQSPICSGDDGLPGELDGITFSKWRNESIKAYGNAIVPQVAFEIFKVIQIIANT